MYPGGLRRGGPAGGGAEKSPPRVGADPAERPGRRRDLVSLAVRREHGDGTALLRFRLRPGDHDRGGVCAGRREIVMEKISTIQKTGNEI